MYYSKFRFPLKIVLTVTRIKKDLKLNEKRESIDAKTEMTEILELCKKKSFYRSHHEIVSISNYNYDWYNKNIESEKQEIEKFQQRNNEVKENQIDILEVRNKITGILKTQWMGSTAE